MQNPQTPDPATIAEAPASKPTKKAQPKRRMARPPADQPDAVTSPIGADEAAVVRPNPRPISKTAAVIALLEREGGATLAELVEATGWLPHTTRATLTGLQKKRHVIARDKRGDGCCQSNANRSLHDALG